MRRTAQLVVFTTAVLAACGVGGCSGRGNRDGALQVRIALTNTPPSFLPVIMAEPQGTFRHEGLIAAVEALSRAGKALQALLGGSADVAAATFEQLVSLAPEQRASSGSSRC
jgi:ABC-type nitrate/sulfonate/bicarbonate transport system substrate-binding protein